MEFASGRRLNRARNISFKDDSFLSQTIRIGGRNGREKCHSIGMTRIRKDLVSFGNFNQVSEVHNADSVGNIANNGKVVRNEQICESVLLLQFLKQVDNLRLN